MEYEATVEATISELFRICTAVPASAQLKRSTAADTESINYSDAHATYDITLGNDLGNVTRTPGPILIIGGPLNMVVFGTQSDAPGRRYVIQFDSVTGVSPNAYGSVDISRSTQTEPDNMFTFLSDWRRCT
jgi:hypothetical protein